MLLSNYVLCPIPNPHIFQICLRAALSSIFLVLISPIVLLDIYLLFLGCVEHWYLILLPCKVWICCLPLRSLVFSHIFVREYICCCRVLPFPCGGSLCFPFPFVVWYFQTFRLICVPFSALFHPFGYSSLTLCPVVRLVLPPVLFSRSWQVVRVDVLRFSRFRACILRYVSLFPPWPFFFPEKKAICII